MFPEVQPYPTVMQILAVPANIAGVKRVVGVTPPRGKNYEVIIAAKEAGVKNYIESEASRP